jgi:hypothetical protein
MQSNMSNEANNFAGAGQDKNHLRPRPRDQLTLVHDADLAPRCFDGVRAFENVQFIDDACPPDDEH